MHESQEDEVGVIRVVVVDDHPIVRAGLRVILEACEDLNLVGEASEGESALELIKEKRPHVVLMDLRMPGIGGLEAICQIRRQWPQVAVIILTTFNEDALMIQGLQAGACGYFLKDSELETLLKAIRTAARGDALIQPEVMERILARAAQVAFPERSLRKKSLLTERERDILQGVARGERSKEIAKRLGLSERTIRAYLTTIYTKLGVDSRASAVAVALECDLLLPEKKR